MPTFTDLLFGVRREVEGGLPALILSLVLSDLLAVVGLPFFVWLYHADGSGEPRVRDCPA
jgi:hypothetical protein